MANKSLHKAKSAKNDEFYTTLPVIEQELQYYMPHFKNKVVYCNCDDPRVSNFFHYFSYQFEHLDLKKLITTCYKSMNPDIFSQHDSDTSIYLEYEGDKSGSKIPDRDEIEVNNLQGDGDFRSDECIEMLRQADIVSTNPPFSLFREYVAQLIEHEKKFIILGNMNAITYKEIFSLIKDNKIWLGINSGAKSFISPDKKELVKFGNITWFTNLPHNRRNEEITLYKKYSKEDYPTYDNYDAINVDKVKDIPEDYSGAMGVPISFLEKYNPKQFEIIKFRKGDDDRDLSINGEYPYFRIIIKRRQ